MATMTLDQLSKNLQKSVRQGAKNRRARVAEESKVKAMEHNWHFGTCLNCGISAYASTVDVCNPKG